MDSIVNSLLTDRYQVTMAYGYWKVGKHNQDSVFEMFFRKNPFKGEFTIFAGLSEVLDLLQVYSFEEEQIAELKEMFPEWDAEFFEYLKTINSKSIVVKAVQEGSVVFPRTPLIQLQGPLVVCQLLETTILNLCNYASLVATNAARIRLRAGNATLLEFGLRRAQGPNGGLSASRYSYLGGFDGTSNVLAGCRYKIPTKGTHAHSYVTSFTGLEELPKMELDGIDLVKKVLEKRVGELRTTNSSELAAFISYAYAYPDGFLALVDTYDTLKSGVPNFLMVAEVLEELGHKPVGIRLDSGDLAYLSKRARKMFGGKKYTIVASNDLDEEVIMALNSQGHEIDSFGIGTNLVTCKAQPALGMVYKLVEIDGVPRIKMSQEMDKMTIPSKKTCYRLYGKDSAVVDLLCESGTIPAKDSRILCRHPSQAVKRAFVVPKKVELLNEVVWNKGDRLNTDNLDTCRKRCKEQLMAFRNDHTRYLNPTPYKVSVTQELFEATHKLWSDEVPILELA